MLNLVCVAVSKNEGRYFKDWIEWHLKLGVEHFFIYDACTELSTFKVLEPYVWKGLVSIIPTTFHPCQNQSYTHCLRRLHGVARWALVIDVDEYINTHGLEDTNLVHWLKNYEKPNIGAVGIAWACYGSNAIDKYEDIPVWKRFTERVDYEGKHSHHTRHIKSFVRPECFHFADDPHWLKTKPGCPTVDPNFRQLWTSEYKSWDFPTDKIILNHYVTKTREEWLEKCSRGSADSGPTAYNARKVEAFDAHMMACEREDNSIWSVAKKIGLMS